MIFDIQYKEPKVYDGYAIAGEILCGPDIIERIEDVVRFTYTDRSSRGVRLDLYGFVSWVKNGHVNRIPVKEWYYRNASVIGTTFKNDPAIYVNKKAVARLSVSDYIRGASHEFSHKLGYGHGSNFPAGSWRGWLLGDREDKTRSVPYMMEELVLQLAKERGMI